MDEERKQAVGIASIPLIIGVIGAVAYIFRGPSFVSIALAGGTLMGVVAGIVAMVVLKTVGVVLRGRVAERIRAERTAAVITAVFTGLQVAALAVIMAKVGRIATTTLPVGLVMAAGTGGVTAIMVVLGTILAEVVGTFSSERSGS